jgi:hypothetical protein
MLPHAHKLGFDRDDPVPTLWGYLFEAPTERRPPSSLKWGQSKILVADFR